MKRFSHIAIIGFYLVFGSATCLQAQSSTRALTSNTNAWLMYFGNHRFSDKLGLHAEVQWRRSEFLSEPQQLLLRTGLDMYFSNGNRFTVGYAYINTHPYGKFAVANAFPEHRLWQQFLTTQKMGRFALSHRFRLEQRNIGNAATGEFSGGRYENRFRYMAKLTYALTPDWKKPLFGAIYDEFMLNFGKEVAYNIFDQNRLYGALGLTLSPDLKLEVGYLYQVVQLRTPDFSGAAPRNRIEENHTLQIGVFFAMPFYRKAAE